MAAGERAHSTSTPPAKPIVYPPQVITGKAATAQRGGGEDNVCVCVCVCVIQRNMSRIEKKDGAKR